MHLLMLCEGDPETPGGSWSGSSASLLDSFRGRGCKVETADPDLYGLRRAVYALRTFSPNRQRWGVQFHLGGPPFRARSRLAEQAIEATQPPPDVILQIGATFHPGNRADIPCYLYCDSNILMARHGAGSGYSEAAHLTPAQLDAVAAREHAVYQEARAIFTLSDRLRRSFIEDFGQAPEKVHTVRAGPNFDLASLPAPAPRPADGTPTILFVGAQFGRKGGDILLEGFRLVRRTVPNARLLIAGPRNLTINDAGVECLGYLRKEVPEERDRLIRAYQESSIFCLPTRFEPFGIVFLEAMFFRLPCVGTDAWAVPEMVQNGVTGFTFPVDDAAALADRLVRLLNDPAQAARMGAAGYEVAAAAFTWPAVVDRMLAVMERS